MSLHFHNIPYENLNSAFKKLSFMGMMNLVKASKETKRVMESVYAERFEFLFEEFKKQKKFELWMRHRAHMIELAVLLDRMKHCQNDQEKEELSKAVGEIKIQKDKTLDKLSDLRLVKL